MHPYFSESEFDRRHETAKKIMAENGLDALLVTGEENYTYFTGAVSLVPWLSFTRPVFCLVPLEGEPIVMTNKALEESTRAVCYVRDVRVYSKTSGLHVELAVKIVREAKLRGRKIGTELGYEQRFGISFNDYEAIRHALPDVDFQDASTLLWKLRMKKSKEEIGLIQRACEITAKARQRCLDELREGATERDVGRVFRRNMIDLKADDVAFVMVNSFLPFQLNRHLQRGSLIYLDGGAKIGGYCCDFSRLATLGPSSESQRSLHAKLVRINDTMSKQLRPGVKCSEIFHVYVEAIRDAGLEGASVGRVGHGQGMLVTEPPSLSADDDTILEPGFVVSTEPSIATNGFYIIEDVHAITEDGKLTLTNETRDLRELLA